MLKIENLSISYDEKLIVKDIDMDIKRGEIIGIVGESGSGKSTFLRSLIGILDKNGKVESGKILFNEENLVTVSKKTMKNIRGNDISFIFQHPELMLDPIMCIEDLFFEAMRVHNKRISRETVMKKAKELLLELNLTDVDRILKSYPFELSGGMCQRVMIAMAMINNPQLLLADEPTSALDVTVQIQVVESLINMSKKYNTSIIIVTHNMGVAAKMVDKIGVMYGGKIVEWGYKDEVLKNPKHPYTNVLIKSIPKMNCKLPEDIEIKSNQFNLKDNKCGFKSICNNYSDICENLDTKRNLLDNNHWILCCEEKVNDFRS